MSLRHTATGMAEKGRRYAGRHWGTSTTTIEHTVAIIDTKTGGRQSHDGIAQTKVQAQTYLDRQTSSTPSSDRAAKVR